MSSKREVWIDYIKDFACILVVLGHFVQSLVKVYILLDNYLCQWFDTTIYYFHVPLFFICSGYLYQKYSCVDSAGAWKNNVIKKAIALGIPYFVFSFATWFLYILFLIFVITHTVKTLTGMAVLSGIAIAGKGIQIAGVRHITDLCDSKSLVKLDLVRIRHDVSIRRFTTIFFKSSWRNARSRLSGHELLVI